MNARIGFVIVLAGALCALRIVRAQGSADSIDQKGAVLSVELEYGPVRLPLKQDYIIVGNADGTEETMPIILLQRYYSCHLYRLAEGRASGGPTRYQSIELMAIGRDGVLTWCQCSDPLSMRMFGVVRANDERNYMTWTYSGSIRFEELGKPTDRLVSVVDWAAGRPRPFAPERFVETDRLFEPTYLGGGPFLGELSVDSIEFRPDGRTVLKVRAGEPHQDKVFTLVFDGKEWRRED